MQFLQYEPAPPGVARNIVTQITGGL
jgi:hypothetical protein